MTAVKMPRASEAACQAAVINAARIGGWRAYAVRSSQTQSGRWSTAVQGDRGFPDIVLCRDHELLIIELKRKPNKVEQEQHLWHDALRRAGVRCGTVYVPERLDALVDFLLARPGDRRPELELAP